MHIIFCESLSVFDRLEKQLIMTDNLGSSGFSISEGIREMVPGDHALENGPWEEANRRQSLFSF